jgi:hypothetical protein
MPRAWEVESQFQTRAKKFRDFGVMAVTSEPIRVHWRVGPRRERMSGFVSCMKFEVVSCAAWPR